MQKTFTIKTPGVGVGNGGRVRGDRGIGRKGGGSGGWQALEK